MFCTEGISYCVVISAGICICRVFKLKCFAIKQILKDSKGPLGVIIIFTFDHMAFIMILSQDKLDGVLLSTLTPSFNHF